MLVDASVLLAAADRREPAHRVCVDLLEGSDDHLVLVEPVVCEVGHLLAARLGTDAEVAFAAALAAGELRVEPVGPAGWSRIHALVAQHRDLPLGVTDAAIVTVAERLDDPVVASLDGDFDVVRPAHVDRFVRLPG